MLQKSSLKQVLVGIFLGFGILGSTQFSGAQPVADVVIGVLDPQFHWVDSDCIGANRARDPWFWMEPETCDPAEGTPTELCDFWFSFNRSDDPNMYPELGSCTRLTPEPYTCGVDPRPAEWQDWGGEEWDRTHCVPANWVVWRPAGNKALPQSGNYKIFARIPEAQGRFGALEQGITDSARYLILHNGKLDEVIRSHQVPNPELYLGEFDFAADGSDEYVYLDDVTADSEKYPTIERAIALADLIFRFQEGGGGGGGGGGEKPALEFSQGESWYTGNVGDPVAPTTGNFTLAEEDVRIPGRGDSALHLRRFYNSIENDAGLFGRGWATAADVRIEVQPEASAKVTFEDGQVRSFFYEDGQFHGRSGVFDELTETSSGWRLVTTDQRVYTFEALDDSRTAGRVVRIADRHGNGTSFLYRANGDLNAMQDDGGRTLNFTVANGRVKTMTDPLGRHWSYGYSGDFLSTVTNPRSGVARYDYDAASGCMSTLTDPENITYLHNVYEVVDGYCRVIEQYDAAGNLATLAYSEGQTVFTDQLGNTTTFFFDDAYRQTAVVDAHGQTETFTWSDDYELLAYTDRRGHAWSYAYDDRSNQTRVICPVGCDSVNTFNAENDPTGTTDALGQTTSLEWNVGNLVGITRADGTGLTSTYDAYGQLTSLTDANGNTTTLEYDTHGNLVRLVDPLSHVTTFTYDLAGRRLSVTDANGNTTALAYDGSDNVVSVTDPKGQASVYEYDLNDRLMRMTDRAGGVRSYEYDVNLRLTAETDPEGHRTEHTYDLMYNRVSTKDPRGNVTTYAYDALYRLTEMRDALGLLTQYAYDANGNLLSVTDPLNGVTEHVYDPRNLRTRTTDALDGVTELEYDALGRLVAIVDPRTARTEYTYDALNRLTQVRDTLDGVNEFAYDPVGNLLSRKDPNGHETLFIYDANDRLVSVVDPEGHATRLAYDSVRNLTAVTNAREAATTITYDANDNVTAVQDALDGVATFAYDAEDRRVSVTDPNGNTTELVYDLDGQITEIREAGGQVSALAYDAAHNLQTFTNAKGNATTRAYDALNRLELQTNPLGHETRFSYDALGRVTRVLDAKSNATAYAYDLLGRLTGVTDALKQSTGYTYDATGNLTRILDANKHATAFEYDLLGRLVKETNAVGSVWSYSYDPAGNLTEKRNGRDQVITYAYDGDDLRARLTFPDKPDVTFAYDEAHNPVQMVDSLGLTGNTFDLLNRLLSSVNHVGQEVAYTYDAAGNRTSFRHEDGSLMTYEYDANNRPRRVVDPEGNVFDAFYDATHNLVRIDYPNRTQSRMRYDKADRLVEVINRAARPRDVISRFRYTLDRVGNRTRTVETHGRPRARIFRTDYEYDATYRLVRSSDSVGRFNEYGFDAVGNRLSLSTNYDPFRTRTDVDPYTVTSEYDDADRLVSSLHSVFGQTAYTYDGDGNRVRRQGPDVWTGADDLRRTDYEYDSENRVTRIANFRQVNSGNWLPRDENTMLYDGLGRLFRRAYDKHQGGGGQKWSDFVYDGLDPVSEYVHPSPQYTTYHRGLGRMLSFREKRGGGVGNLYYYHHDGLGSVSAITKHQGQSVHRYRYTDYGVPVDNNGRAADSSNFTKPHNHFTYTGQEWVEETWMVHFHAREYDPVAGVWPRADDFRGTSIFPASMNRYTFVLGNPINISDEYGYLGLPGFIAGAIGGAAVGLIGGLIGELVDEILDPQGNEFSFVNVLTSTATGALVGGACVGTGGVLCGVVAPAAAGAVEGLVDSIVKDKDPLSSVVIGAFTAGTVSGVSSLTSKAVDLPNPYKVLSKNGTLFKPFTEGSQQRVSRAFYEGLTDIPRELGLEALLEPSELSMDVFLTREGNGIFQNEPDQNKEASPKNSGPCSRKGKEC